MCEFCTQHGDGKKWYLQAENYAVDLSRDLQRREYVVDFVSGFESRMRRNVPLLKAVRSSPRPIRAAFRSITEPRQLRDHFGQPVPIEDCERIFDIATSIVQVPCVCRHFAKTPEKGYCLGVTVLPADDVFAEAFRDFASGPDTSAFQRLTREQAVALLRHTETEGLMHSVWTFKTPFIAGICNCDLASGCMAMKSTLELGYRTMWKGEYLAEVDDTACVGCGACAERCGFGALSMADGGAQVDADACYGCGICRSACGFDAIALRDRPGAAQSEPATGLATER